jgi:ubiquinone/menaquinone biosynthesis C-methylase UbiE
MMTSPAENYELGAVPVFFAPWADCLIRAVNPVPGERVLDVGCGTGIVARRVKRLMGSRIQVAGIDMSPEMLAVARAASKREGLGIEWREGRAEKLPYPDASFDLVLSQFALMFFTDRRAALGEIHRVLAADGRIGVSVFQGIDQHPFYVLLDNAIKRKLGASGVGEIFSLGNADALLRLTQDAGFSQIEITPDTLVARFPQPEEFLSGEIELDTAAIPSMQKLDARGRKELVQALQKELAAPLREVTVGNEVVLPFHAYIVRAER